MIVQPLPPRVYGCDPKNPSAASSSSTLVGHGGIALRLISSRTGMWSNHSNCEPRCVCDPSSLASCSRYCVSRLFQKRAGDLRHLLQAQCRLGCNSGLTLHHVADVLLGISGPPGQLLWSIPSAWIVSSNVVPGGTA